MASMIDGVALLGTQLQALLQDNDGIVPGANPGYQLCKAIYSHHPHGAKLVDFPIQMAQYRPRKITVPRAPDDGAMLIEAFHQEWRKLKADRHIFNAGRLARIYGVSTLGLMVAGDNTAEPVDFVNLAKRDIAFNCWDPLNTAGSLVLNQDPNSIDFQKVPAVAVGGVLYHRSRTCVTMNEDPLYIEYESAGFGFLGRSVYQRGLVPLKSFLYTLATDMMIALKAGVLVAKVKSPSSAVDGPMAWIMGQKRAMVKEAQVGNVLSIDVTEEIQSLNLQNLDGAYALARKNIIENEAAACGTPAKIVLAETFAEGFGEGTEDAKAVAQFIETIRAWLDPLYEFMDLIVMYRAWNPEFYETVQARYPEAYGKVSYNQAFQDWKNNFRAEWPNLLEEPDSEKLKGEDVVLKAIISVFEVLAPELPQEEKANLIAWVQDNLNEKRRLFASPLNIDIEAVAAFEPPAPPAMDTEPTEERPEGLTDSVGRRALRRERMDAVDDEMRASAAKSALAVNALRLVQGQSVPGLA